MNIVTVKTMVEVTPQLAYDYLVKLGITSLVESRTEDDGRVVSDLNPSMALGGLTDGVSNLELTGAYAAIANGGIYNEPTFYTRIEDRNGKVILDYTPKKEQVIKDSTAFLLTSAMEDVVNIGTGKAAKFTSIDMPEAGKTGSTSDYNDLWFVGFTPYYTAGIWSGYDNNRTQVDKSYHKVIWRKIMEQISIDKKLETKDFVIPDSIVTAKVCKKSGKLAVDGVCDAYLGGDSTEIEYFAKGTEPTEKCDVHVTATICNKSKALATEFCPEKFLKEGVFLNKTETAVTNDTPYLLPSVSCLIHTQSTVIPPTPTAVPAAPATPTTVPTTPPDVIPPIMEIFQ
jgi:penicillin-binding protein 1A